MEITDHVLRTAMIQQSSDTKTSNSSLRIIFKSFLGSLVSLFGAKIQYRDLAVAILISGTRQTNDDVLDYEACSIGETPVLTDDQPSNFKRPAT